jgi:hypothetical protein
MKLTRAMKNGAMPIENPKILESKIHSKDSKEQTLSKKSRKYKI